MKSKHILFAIVLLGAFFRFWQLGRVPMGVTNDELGYIYNAYALATTGKNIFGESWPLFTWVNIHGFPFMPTVTYLLVPVVKIFGLSATTGRIVGAATGTLSVYLLYALTYLLTRKRGVSLVSALFLAISPWHIFFSRTAYDATVASFFYLSALVAFIVQTQKRQAPVAAPVLLLLALYSYRGMSPLFPIFVILLLWYGVSQLKINAKHAFVFIALVALVILSWLMVITRFASRGFVSEAAIDRSKMQTDLDTHIREATGPLALRRLYLNKVTYTLTRWRENYLDGLSPSFLFLRGEGNQIYSIWSRGKFSVLDIVFIALGLFYLFRTTKLTGVFVTGLVLASAIPGMIGGSPYAMRNFFMSVVTPILTASGVVFVSASIRNKAIQRTVLIFVTVGYVYVVGGFLFDYFNRYAHQRAEAWFKSLKDVSMVIAQQKQSYDHIVVGTSSFADFLQYAFYTKTDPSSVQQAWHERVPGPKERFTVDNVTFALACYTTDDEILRTYDTQARSLFIAHEGCERWSTPSSFIRDYYGNKVWLIYDVIP